MEKKAMKRVSAPQKTTPTKKMRSFPGGFAQSEPAIHFIVSRKKSLSKIKASDVPPGLEPDQVAS